MPKVGLGIIALGKQTAAGLHSDAAIDLSKLHTQAKRLLYESPLYEDYLRHRTSTRLHWVKTALGEELTAEKRHARRSVASVRRVQPSRGVPMALRGVKANTSKPLIATNSH